MDDVIKIINNAKSKNEACLKIFGYSNKRVYEKLQKIIDDNEINISHFGKKIKYCRNCGKKIDKNKKFCNSSCSATFNNKNRKMSEETKEKIRNKLKTGRTKYFKKCSNCNKIYESIKKNQKYCSIECVNDAGVSIETRKKISNIMKKLIKEGKHKGWQSRNILSYPEKFFIKVLNNNNISFEHNKVINKKDLGLDEPYNYFLDFYIKDKKIDLEIDGSQHNEPKRIKSDKKRDYWLKKNGYNVYRIKWKNINNEKGKKYIKNEINKFLNFYKNADFA